jgi:nitrile hydratase accessory protein
VIPERPDDDRPFTEPWQARAFALAVVTAERAGVPWDEFRDRLKTAIATRPDQQYYESWLDALEDLAGSLGPASPRPDPAPVAAGSRTGR